jgi:histidinol-phosphatase
MQANLELALELADIADRISLSRFRASDLQVETKPDLSPVTEADRAVEEALRTQIANARPDHGVVGEEFGSSGPAGARWIIDPIDATKNYVRGVPVWATLLALEVEGELVLGLVSAPALRRRWWAARGAGAFADGEPIAVSRISKLADAHILFSAFDGGDPPGWGESLLKLGSRCWRMRGFGDFWQHMLVAEGSAEVALEPAVSLWDMAAVQVIVEEAGGSFSDLGGARRADGGNAISSNGLLHEEVLHQVHPTPAPENK